MQSQILGFVASVGGGVISAIAGSLLVQPFLIHSEPCFVGPEVWPCQVTENPFHSPAWWVVSLISFMIGFFLTWKYAFKPKRAIQ
jgi:hypothetical protein